MKKLTWEHWATIFICSFFGWFILDFTGVLIGAIFGFSFSVWFYGDTKK